MAASPRPSLCRNRRCALRAGHSQHRSGHRGDTVKEPGMPRAGCGFANTSSSGERMDGIADYRFVRFIGEGGHGAFYLVTPPPRLKLDSQVVGVKLLSGLTDEDALRRATRELRAFASAQSPYLVTLLDAGREGSTFFYAMEYCPLGSLESPERPLERRETLIAVAQAARGAHALHEAGLVHRSIKPANVLLVEHGARLADLGLAHALAPTQTVTGLGSIGAWSTSSPTCSPATRRPVLPTSGHWASRCIAPSQAPASTARCLQTTPCSACARCSAARRSLATPLIPPRRPSSSAAWRPPLMTARRMHWSSPRTSSASPAGCLAAAVRPRPESGSRTHAHRGRPSRAAGRRRA